MNKNILNLIKETISSEKENYIDSLYRKIWFSVLDQFRLNYKKNEIVLLLNERVNEYYNLLYYTGESIVEIQFKMTKSEKEMLLNLLLADGFKIKDSAISISREKIISYANKDELSRRMIAVPEVPINMIDEYKIKRHQ